MGGSIAAATAAFDASAIRYLVVGGIAVGYHGAPRYTKVLDVLVHVSEQDVEKLFDLVATHAGPAMLTYDDDPDVRLLAAAHGFRVGDVAMKSTHHVVMRELAILKD